MNIIKFIAAAIFAVIFATPAFATAPNLAVCANKLQVLEASIRKNPTDLQVRRYYVEVLVSAGRAKSAETEMEGLVRAGLRSANDFALMADVYRYNCEFNKAIHYYQEALNIVSDDAHAKSGLALTYMQAGAPKIAKKLCLEGLTVSKDVNGRRELVKALATIDDAQKSIAASKQVACVDGVRL